MEILKFQYYFIHFLKIKSERIINDNKGSKWWHRVLSPERSFEVKSGHLFSMMLVLFKLCQRALESVWPQGPLS
jgi:hypothetical protein